MSEQKKKYSLLNDSWNFAKQPDVIQDTNKFNKTENEMFY